MSLFGEIVEPSSRATWEDWDDIPDNSTSKLQWQNDIDINEEINTFILFEGQYLKHFVNTKSQDLQLINKIKEVDLNLYKINLTQSKYICTLKDYNLMLSSDIIEMLTPYLQLSKNVIALKIVSISEYHSNQPNIQPYVLRGIYTSNTSTEFEYPKLEQPNILSGVSAGVITLREQLDQMGLAVICYVEYMDYYQEQELQKILNKLGIGSVFVTGPNNITNSNLYI